MAGSTRSRRPRDSPDESGRIPVRRGAKALLIASGRALLVQERHANGSTFWTLPGGGLASGETFKAALRRELDEELNCRPPLEEEVGHFWYVHSGKEHALTRYTVFAGGPVTDFTPSISEGILDAEWFQPSKCPAATLPQVQYLLDDVVGRRSISGFEGARASPPPATPGASGRSGR